MRIANALLAMLTIAPATLGQDADRPEVAGDLPLVFEADFEAEDAEGWSFTDPEAWTIGDVEGNRVLELNAASDYEPSVRSPLNIAWIDGAGPRRLRPRRQAPLHDARLRAPRPLPLLRQAGPRPLLLRPPRQGGRPARPQHLPRRRRAPRLHRPGADRRHPLDRRLAPRPSRPQGRIGPDRRLLRRHGHAHHDLGGCHLRTRGSRRRFVRRHRPVRRPPHLGHQGRARRVTLAEFAAGPLHRITTKPVPSHAIGGSRRFAG